MKILAIFLFSLVSLTASMAGKDKDPCPADLLRNQIPAKSSHFEQSVARFFTQYGDLLNVIGQGERGGKPAIIARAFNANDLDAVPDTFEGYEVVKTVVPPIIPL